eukprot:1149578-Pelagomonas_calceolata.AAC.1
MVLFKEGRAGESGLLAILFLTQYSIACSHPQLKVAAQAYLGRDLNTLETSVIGAGAGGFTGGQIGRPPFCRVFVVWDGRAAFGFESLLSMFSELFNFLLKAADVPGQSA